MEKVISYCIQKNPELKKKHLFKKTSYELFDLCTQLDVGHCNDVNKDRRDPLTLTIIDDDEGEDEYTCQLYKCSMCGIRATKYIELQMRRSDEGSTQFIVCRCGHRWRSG